MPHSLRAVTNKMHQNGDFFSQFLSAARSARGNDVIILYSRWRFHSPFHKFPISWAKKSQDNIKKIPRLNVRRGKQVYMQ